MNKEVVNEKVTEKEPTTSKEVVEAKKETPKQSEFEKAFEGFCSDNGIDETHKENWAKIIQAIPKEKVGNVIDNIKAINSGKKSDWNMIFKSDKSSGKVVTPTSKEDQSKGTNFGSLIKFNKEK